MNRFSSLVALALLLTVMAAAPAHGKTYAAERFDATIRVLPGGHLEVVETVVFRFESGTFEHVFRELPTRRTDGIEIVSATMDGRPMPFGNGPGYLEITERARVRVRWRFPPLSGSTHTFVLTYRVRGVVRQDVNADVLAWRALPGRHDYRIGSSTIDVLHSAPRSGEPIVDTHRIAAVSVDESDEGIRTVASDIRPNGWLEVRLFFPPGTVADGAPAWQQRQTRNRELAPTWLLAAGLLFAAGLVLLVGLRQRYDAPPRGYSPSAIVPAPPDPIAPALAGVLAANGGVGIDHALAALFTLADRGEIVIAEEPRGTFGQRSFTLRRQRTGRPLSPYEEAAIRTVFTEKGGESETVSLAKARSRLTSRSGTFKTEVRRELERNGLLSQERNAMRDRLGHVSLGMLVLGSIAMVAAAFLARQYDAWPLVIPAALVLAAVVGFTIQGATTPLSNEGVQRGERWRAFRRYLRDVAQDRAHLTSESPAGLLPFAIAFGLAPAWARYVRQHPAGTPAWFSAAASLDADKGAFPALVAATGAGSSGGGAGGGGAAGGGASGAGS